MRRSSGLLARRSWRPSKERGGMVRVVHALRANERRGDGGGTHREMHGMRLNQLIERCRNFMLGGVLLVVSDNHSG